MLYSNITKIDKPYSSTLHTITSADGMECEGIAILPTEDFKENSLSAILLLDSLEQANIWVNEGYAVLCLPTDNNDIKSDALHITEFLDSMLRYYPTIDKSRIAVIGRGRGATLVNWIIGNTNQFCCAISEGGVSNWTSHAYSTDAGYEECFMRFKSVEDGLLLWENSPLKFANKAKTPTLLLHGDKDELCFYQESISFFTALKMHGTVARMCLFHGESHNLPMKNEDNTQRRLSEMKAWLTNYLKREAM